MTNQPGKITLSASGKIQAPDYPIIPYVEGDGIGPDIWAAAVRVWDAAVGRAYGGQRKVFWREVLAGEKAFAQKNAWLPPETLDTIRDCRIAIKGPLSTPV